MPAKQEVAYASCIRPWTYHNMIHDTSSFQTFIPLVPLIANNKHRSISLLIFDWHFTSSRLNSEVIVFHAKTTPYPIGV